MESFVDRLVKCQPTEESLELAKQFDAAAVAVRLLVEGLDAKVTELGVDTVLFVTECWDSDDYQVSDNYRNLTLRAANGLLEVAAMLRRPVHAVPVEQ
jgi:hypothetical protein